MIAPNYMVEKVDEERWLVLTARCRKYNYRQSWNFGALCASRFNAQSEHVIINDGNGLLVGAADVRIKRLPIIGGGIAYISGGPLIVKTDEHIDFERVVSALVFEYVDRQSLNLRVMPPPMNESQAGKVRGALISLGFVERFDKKQTILIDLSQSLDDIRKHFHQKWRNCLNKAEKGNVTFKSGTELAYFEEFKPLLEELIVDKNFSIDLNVDFYMNVQRCAAQQDKFVVTLAQVDGVTVAGFVGSFLGDTGVYLLGAADNLGRKVNAAYLLQWQAIMQAKSSGCLWYDLGGIDPVVNPGVYRFKKRMGGVEVVFPGPFEYKASGWCATLTSAGEWLYKRLRR